MAEKTYIEWADSTLNLMAGCDGCELWKPAAGIHHCYAGKLTRRYEGEKGWPVKFETPLIFPERIKKALAWSDLTGQNRPDKPWLNGLPRIIFLNDMGDTFTESLPVDWLAPFLSQIAESPHQWLILTKRPRRFAEFAGQHPLPKNVWAGTSVTGPGTLKRVTELLRVPATIRFLSAEPLLAPVDLSMPLGLEWSDVQGSWIDNREWVLSGKPRGISFVIVGGESGPGARPMNPDWARMIRDQCVAAGTAFFMKQMDKVQPIPDDLFVRQFPCLTDSRAHQS